MHLYDAHNHLQDAWLAPHRAQVLRDLAAIPLRGTVVNGTCEADWPEVADVCAQLSALGPAIVPIASYGLHPWNVGNATPAWHDTLRRHLAADARAAVGEIGLDRWILESAKPDDSRLAGLRRASLEEQTAAFARQLALAAELGRAVTIHCLDAWGALLAALRAVPQLPRGFLVHAYGGSAEIARELVPLGAFFSFNGYFLGERQAAKRAVFAALPADRLLVETDAPAMPLPAARRAFALPGLADGNPINHPANIGAVYAGLAEVRGVAVDALATQVEENFRRLFGPR